jgi:hypothetical protein
MLPLQVAGSEFSESVRPSFDQWIELLKQEQQLRLQLGYGIRQSDEYKELAARTGAARRAFANDVAAHWPFKTDDKTKRMLNEATQAMVEARKYAQAYHEGQGNRDEVQDKLLAVADQFPGTIEADESLFVATQ